MLTPHQQEIHDKVLECLKSKQSCTLSGYAGTGKSFVTNILIRNLDKLRYIFLAPTHKALSVVRSKEKELNQMSGMQVVNSRFETVAKFLGMKPDYSDPNLDVENPNFTFDLVTEDNSKLDIVIVDECSMISKTVFNQLMKRPFTYLFIGDIQQLPPIGESSSKTFEMDNIFYLTEIVRTKKDDIVNLCSLARTDNYRDILSLKESENVKVIKKSQYKFDAEKILCFTNSSVFKFNNKAKKLLNPSKTRISAGDKIMFYQDIFIPAVPEPVWLKHYNEKMFYAGLKIVSNCDEFEIKTVTELEKFDKIVTSENDEFYMLKPKSYDEFRSKYLTYKTDRDLKKLFTLKYGCVLPEPIKTVYSDGEENKSIEIKKTFDLAYALTIHKSQGSTYESVAVDVKDILISKDDAKTLLYTAVSRAKEKVILLM